jgi:hypothetical protein
VRVSPQMLCPLACYRSGAAGSLLSAVGLYMCRCLLVSQLGSLILLILLQRISLLVAEPCLGLQVSVGTLLFYWGLVCLGEVLSPCSDCIPLCCSIWVILRSDLAGSSR